MIPARPTPVRQGDQPVTVAAPGVGPAHGAAHHHPDALVLRPLVGVDGGEQGGRVADRDDNSWRPPRSVGQPRGVAVAGVEHPARDRRRLRRPRRVGVDAAPGHLPRLQEPVGEQRGGPLVGVGGAGVTVSASRPSVGPRSAGKVALAATRSPLAAALAPVEDGDLVGGGEPHRVLLVHAGSRGEHGGPRAVTGPQPRRQTAVTSVVRALEHDDRVRAEPQRPPQPGDLRRAPVRPVREHREPRRERGGAVAPQPGVEREPVDGAVADRPRHLVHVHVRRGRDRSGVGLGRMLDVGPHALRRYWPPPPHPPPIAAGWHSCHPGLRNVALSCNPDGPAALGAPCCRGRSTGSTVGSG